MKTTTIKLGKKILSLISNISPSLNAKILFMLRTHKIPNLKKPKTFNEKTTYLKLYKYNNDQRVSLLADKYSVRKFIEDKGYGDILNELYGVYNNFDEIDFNKLPNKFALKCTHGCAYNIICDDKEKLNKEKAKSKIDEWLKEKYGYATSELHYTKIKPRIIAEKYLCDENGLMPKDYKMYCMNGKVNCILVCSERDNKLKLSYYDNNWNRLKYEKEEWSSKIDIEKPKNLNKMISIAEDLSKDFPFVRVDFYNDNGNIIFGELTFTPACSCAPYYNNYGNNYLGKQLKL